MVSRNVLVYSNRLELSLAMANIGDVIAERTLSVYEEAARSRSQSRTHSNSQTEEVLAKSAPLIGGRIASRSRFSRDSLAVASWC